MRKHTSICMERRKFLKALGFGFAAGALGAGGAADWLSANRKCWRCGAVLASITSDSIPGDADPLYCPNCGKRHYDGRLPPITASTFRPRRYPAMPAGTLTIPFPSAVLVARSTKPLMPYGILYFEEGGRKV